MSFVGDQELPTVFTREVIWHYMRCIKTICGSYHFLPSFLRKGVDSMGQLFWYNLTRCESEFIPYEAFPLKINVPVWSRCVMQHINRFPLGTEWWSNLRMRTTVHIRSNIMYSLRGTWNLVKNMLGLIDTLLKNHHRALKLYVTSNEDVMTNCLTVTSEY